MSLFKFGSGWQEETCFDGVTIRTRFGDAPRVTIDRGNEKWVKATLYYDGKLWGTTTLSWLGRDDSLDPPFDVQEIVVVVEAIVDRMDKSKRVTFRR